MHNEKKQILQSGKNKIGKKAQTLTNMLWGLGVLAFLAVLVLQKLNLIQLPNIWHLLGTLLFGGVAIYGLVRFDLEILLFSSACLVNLYKQALGIGDWSIWYLLGVALLLDIGLNLVISPWSQRRHLIIHTDAQAPAAPKSLQQGAEQLDIRLKVGEMTRYLKSTDFRVGSVKMWIGEVKLFFDEVHIQDQAQIWLDGWIGDIDLYVPQDWQVIDQVQVTTGEVNERGVKAHHAGPTLYLTGHLKIGEVTIHYVSTQASDQFKQASLREDD